MVKIVKATLECKEEGTKDDLLKFVFENERAADEFRKALIIEDVPHFSLGRKSTVFVAMSADKG